MQHASREQPRRPAELPEPSQDAPPREQLAYTVLMFCRAMLMFIGWANRYYRLGLHIRDRHD